MTAQFSSPRSPVLYYAWQDPEPLSVLQNKGALDRQVDQLRCLLQKVADRMKS